MDWDADEREGNWMNDRSPRSISLSSWPKEVARIVNPGYRNFEKRPEINWQQAVDRLPGDIEAAG